MPSCGSSPTFVCLCICVLLCLDFVCLSATSARVVLPTFLHVFITLLVFLPCLLPFKIYTASVFALLVATKFLQLNIAVFLPYLHTFLSTYLFIPHLYFQRECLPLETCRTPSILLQLNSPNSGVHCAFIVFIAEVDSKTMFIQSMGLRQLVIGLVTHHLQFLTILHFLNIWMVKGNLYSQTTFPLKFMIKNFLAHYHHLFPLMMYPWILTLDHHVLMTMMKMMIMATILAGVYTIMIFMVVMVIAPLPLFQAVHSMNQGHIVINKHLQMINFSGEFIMTNSMVNS